MNTFFIQTFGCQMNVADTDQMKAVLAEAGMRETQDRDQADVLLVNGCSVREKAVHKAVSALGRFRVSKKKHQILGLGGCVGQLDQGQTFRSQPELDFVFGPDAIENLPDLLHRVRSGEKHLVATEFDRTSSYSTRTRLIRPQAQAFVNIMKGCDKYCTYCIVPFTRGREKSRTIDEVLGDVAQLVSQGVSEVTLLGQNVNSFGKGNSNTKQRTPEQLHNAIGKVGPDAGQENFPQLLRAMEADPRLADLKRIRYTSSHPLDFSDELIECYRDLKKLARHLHLPVQSGSNTVLRRMARHHKIEDYIAQMERLKVLCPDVGLSTDLIVGFPGETEEEFQETLTLLDRLQYDQIYAFAYSPRPGTRASKLEDDVSKETKNRRLQEVLARSQDLARRTHERRLGQTMEVLVEGTSKNEGLLSEKPQFQKIWAGRTSCNRVVNFVTPSPRPLTGKFVQVRIEGFTGLSLKGEMVA